MSKMSNDFPHGPLPADIAAEIRRDLNEEFHTLASNDFVDEIKVNIWVHGWVGATRLGLPCKKVAADMIQWAEEALVVWPRHGQPEQDEASLKAIRDWCGKVAVKQTVDILRSSVIDA